MTFRPARSLKLRLVLATLAALAAAVMAAGLLACWTARANVRSELAAALAGGERTTGDAIQQIEGAQARPSAADADVEINRTIQLFGSGRHLRAIRYDSAAKPVIAARPLTPADTPPAWFQALFAPHLAPSKIQIPASLGGGYVELVVDPLNELDEVWSGFKDIALGLLIFMALALVLIYRTTGAVLAPLTQVRDVLSRIGEGDYGAKVTVGLSPELDPVARGVNAMGEKLEAALAENLRLQEQMLSLQEEERADIARDLHDEVGPYLFALSIDAAAVGQLAAKGPKGAAIRERVGLIEQAVRHAQSHVRDMLGRLRPVRQVEFSLASALEDLAVFWRARAAGVAFDLDLDFAESSLRLEAREALYRVAQEALSNAMRHAKPSRIWIAADESASGLELTIGNDGPLAAGGGRAPGYGLIGMRERVEALGGELVLGEDRENGWLVRVSLPRHESALEAAQ